MQADGRLDLLDRRWAWRLLRVLTSMPASVAIFRDHRLIFICIRAVPEPQAQSASRLYTLQVHISCGFAQSICFKERSGATVDRGASDVPALGSVVGRVRSGVH
jgi:hypothetical protein